MELIKGVDILLEGNRPGVMEKIGLGPKDIHKVNAKLYTSGSLDGVKKGK